MAHKHAHPELEYNHDFNGDDRSNERRTLVVVIFTVVMMALEIAGGSLFGSMALLADGWHMGTHAVALGITLLAYMYSRRHARNPKFTFGTGKVGVLGGYTSALLLLVVAGFMVAESIQRLVAPRGIQFNEALIVAGIGLTVNLVSALLLGGGHGHSHAGEEHHAHAHSDHNIRAAYLHVLADALTSVFAILALVAGKWLGWIWMDAVVGIAGAVVITRWAIGLILDTGRILLDSSVDTHLMETMRSRIEADADNQVCDLHVWRVDSEHLMATISVVTNQPRPAEHYRQLLDGLDGLVHVIIEVNACDCL